MIASTDIFDPFVRCAEPGCMWHIELPERRCAEHGGSPSAQAYRTRADGGVEVVLHSRSGMFDYPEGAPI